MKQYKIDILNQMNKMSDDLVEISLREASLAVGINHLTRQECLEIGNAFVKKHPAYRLVKMNNPKNVNESLFTTLVATCAEYEEVNEL